MIVRDTPVELPLFEGMILRDTPVEYRLRPRKRAAIRHDSAETKKQWSPTPLFKPVKLFDYLTYFDKIDGAADIMIISDMLDTLNPQSRLERLMHGLFGCPSARQTA